MRVDGQLVLTGCQINGTGRPPPASRVGRGLGVERLPGLAISATRITVTAGMFMDGGFTADGQIRLIAAHVAGALSLSSAQLRNPGAIALLAPPISPSTAGLLPRRVHR